ncbi:MAG: DNA adenine methylase [Thermodesulfobacteriota bacterium]
MLSDIFYLQRAAFGGKVVDQTFGTATERPPRVNLFNLETSITEAWQRLAGVTIECLDFRKLIPRYDKSHTFFFLDPPYWAIPGYRHDFEEKDFLDLADVLRDLKGKFLMTINDTSEVREIFSRFKIEEVQLKYSLSSSMKARSKTHTELFISN